MMNLLALSLVVTSLAAAGFWSPSPAKTTINGDSNVMVKEGHRVVVIEYDKDGHENTKVVISPEHDNTNVIRKPESVSNAEDKIASTVGHAKDKAKDAASGLRDLGQGISDRVPVDGVRHGAKEVICDAFGKCREKIADAVGRGRDKGEEEVEGVKEGARDAKYAVGDAYGKAKETAGEKARDSVRNAKDTVKSFGDDVVKNASGTAEMAREKAKGTVRGMAGKAKSGAKKVAETVSKPPRMMYGLTRYLFPMETISSLMNVVNLLGFSTAYGMCMWVTFVSSNVLAAALPRQQFGMVQSKVYPVYFRAMAFSIGMALLGHVLSHRKQLVSNQAERLQGCNLLGSLIAVLVNSAYLEPRATKVMFERMKIEKEEGRGIGATTRAGETERGAGITTERDGMTTTAPSTTVTGSESVEQEIIRSQIMKLNQKLKKLNTYSSFANILTLMGLTWHLVYLGQRLHVTC